MSHLTGLGCAMRLSAMAINLNVAFFFMYPTYNVLLELQ